MAATEVLGLVGSIIGIVSTFTSALIVARYDQLQSQRTSHPVWALLDGVCQKGMLKSFEACNSSASIYRRSYRWQGDGDGVGVEERFRMQSYPSWHPCAFQQSTLLQDPPPAAFVLACVTFCLTIGSLYRSSKGGIYPAYFLAVGLTSGFTTGLYMKVDMQGIMLSYLPWSVTAALVASVMVGAIHRGRERINRALAERYYDLVRRGQPRNFKKDGEVEEKKELGQIETC